jgi:hypothetical protein
MIKQNFILKVDEISLLEDKDSKVSKFTELDVHGLIVGKDLAKIILTPILLNHFAWVCDYFLSNDDKTKDLPTITSIDLTDYSSNLEKETNGIYYLATTKYKNINSFKEYIKNLVSRQQSIIQNEKAIFIVDNLIIHDNNVYQPYKVAAVYIEDKTKGFIPKIEKQSDGYVLHLQFAYIKTKKLI